MLCKTCNKEHDGSFGSGKFCCRACANSRVKTDDVKQKISSTINAGITSGKIVPTSRKGIKHSNPRSQDHADKISSGIKKCWDQKGRLTPDQKKAGVKAAVYAYRARKKNAVPADADLNLIRKIYEAAPAGYQIDHIVPLAKGGLHHQDNLQYLPFNENQRKGTKLDFPATNAVRWQDLLK